MKNPSALYALCFLVALFCNACGNKTAITVEASSPRKIVYWEKWTGFEGEAIDRVVARFNDRERARAKSEAGYRPIEVKKITTSKILEKLLVAIAGGNAPDVAGLYTPVLAAYVEKGALEELSQYANAANIKRGDYIPAFWDMCMYRGKLWALPTTPSTVALHWNKRLFREAGLDPEHAPQTIEELDLWAERLTMWEVTQADGSKIKKRGYCPEIKFENKRLLQVGFLPAEPGWWNYAWGFYFGGKLIEQGKASADSPENIAAFTWIAKYSQKLGVKNIQRFRGGFGSFSSPQNPFMSSKVAMEIQGVWMYNFIEKYAPGMQWGAAAFPPPAAHPEWKKTALVEADLLVIPRDAKHPKEAFEFIRYVNSQEAMELLCGVQGHRKFSPLRQVSDEFYQSHPHPEIRLFRELAESPNSYMMPQAGIWDEYKRELKVAYDHVQNMSDSPEIALKRVRERIQKALDRNNRMLARRHKSANIENANSEASP